MRNKELFFKDYKTTRPQDYKSDMNLLSRGLVVLLTLYKFSLNNDFLDFICSIIIWHEFESVHWLCDYHVS